MFPFIYCGQFSTAQTYFWVKFTDKKNSPYTIDAPQQYLSQAAIERRIKENIPIDSTDLPVSPAYIQAIAPHVSQIKHCLRWFNMAVVRLDGQQVIDSLLQFPFVADADTIHRYPFAKNAADKSESVTRVNQQYVHPNPYGFSYRQVSMLNTDLLHQLGYSGKGIVMAFMDNGYYNLPNIAAFDSMRPNILGTYDFVDDESDVYDDSNHGTNVLSCAGANWPGYYVGTAPHASYYLLVSEDDNAEWLMEEYNWAAAAEWADSAGAQIFSTSLGYTTFDDDLGNHTYADLDGNTTVITRAGNIAASKGIIVCNSAGNEGNKPWYYISAAADGEKIVAVGAVDSFEVIANFSGRGPAYGGAIKPNVCAQGKGNYCITIHGDVGITNGTSFSCPAIAGSIAALWSAFPDKTSGQILDAVYRSCDRYHFPDNEYGYGIPDFYAAYLMLLNDTLRHLYNHSDDIIIFPNPFTDNLRAAITGTGSRWHGYEVFDLYGRKLLSDRVYIRHNTFEILSLEALDGLPPGEYLMRWEHTPGRIFRLLKTK
ncbi:MAG: S8 family serine peptidase [Chitinophagales bacterium]|nr:S8 family serine peptidase [Chitinophagales bacterium]